MILENVRDGFVVAHDLSDFDSFSILMKRALENQNIGVALGPLYDKDPAVSIIEAFKRSATESNWNCTPAQMFPEEVNSRIKSIREAAVANIVDDITLNQWARAGLVLEIASIYGINIGIRKIHPRWKLNGTVTGRFGCSTEQIVSAWDNEMWYFSPLTIPEAKRNLIVPSSKDRRIATIDFNGIDVCSMFAIAKSVPKEYEDCDDIHRATAKILFETNDPTDLNRDVSKIEIFKYAYGGHTEYMNLFAKKLAQLSMFRDMPPGEAGKLVQSVSAIAFRAALSKALPSLTSLDVKPMFTVHDELVLDYSRGHEDKVLEVSKQMELGATEMNLFPYRTRVKLNGKHYGEVK